MLTGAPQVLKFPVQGWLAELKELVRPPHGRSAASASVEQLDRRTAHQAWALSSGLTCALSGAIPGANFLRIVEFVPSILKLVYLIGRLPLSRKGH